MIRVTLPPHLRKLAQVDGEVKLEVQGKVTQRSVLDALENHYPMLRGTIRDHATQRRRAFVRFFACQQDLSHELPFTGAMSRQGCERDGRRRGEALEASISGAYRTNAQTKEVENDQQNFPQSPCERPRQIDGVFQSGRLLVQPAVHGQNGGLHGDER
jgi:hypothetical protein